MRNLISFCLVLGLTACATTAPPEATDTSLPSTFKDGFAYVRVSVNGAAPVWMEIDDGTSPSAIDLDYAKSLRLVLKAGAGSGTGFGTQKIQFFNTQATVTAGDVARTIDFSAAPLTGLVGPDGQPLMGVLGYSFLKDRIVVIDYPKGEVRFQASSAPCTCDLHMGVDNDIPTVPVTIAGHAMTALVDSGGAYELLVTPPGVAAAGLQAEAAAAKPVTGYGYAGQQAAAIGTAPGFRVGGITRANPSTVYSTFGTAPLKTQAALGTWFLRNYKVTLNYRARTVRFE